MKDKVELKTILYSSGEVNRLIEINGKEVKLSSCWEEFSFDDFIEYTKDILDVLNVEYEYSEERLISHH